MRTIQKKSLRFILACVAIATSTSICKPANAGRNKVHEIGWSSRLSSMGLNKADNLGKEYTFLCQAAPEDLIHAPIWGTNSYTPNSGICSTAVHAGMIKAEDGGKITIELVEGEAFYTGSYKNEVTSQDHRNTEMSFTFVGEPISQEQVNEDSQPRRSSGIQRVMVKGVERGVERSIERAIDKIFE